MMNTIIYTVGDEVRVANLNQFGRVIDDSNSSNGYYEVKLDNGDEYTFHISELN